MIIATELKMNTVEELQAHIASISVIQPTESISEEYLSPTLSSSSLSYLDIHKDGLSMLDIKIFEALWNNQIYFKTHDFYDLSDDSSKLFQIVRSSLKYDLTRGVIDSLTKYNHKFAVIINKLSHEQISTLISDNLITINDITSTIKGTYNDVSNLVNFVLDNGWDVVNKGLPTDMRNINLDTLKLAIKKGLKPEYIVDHINKIYDFTTLQQKIDFISVVSGVIGGRPQQSRSKNIYWTFYRSN